MNDQTAQNKSQATQSSYVDDYVPPTNDSNLSDVPLDVQTTDSSMTVSHLDAKVTDTEEKTLDQSSTDLGAHDSSFTDQPSDTQTTKDESDSTQTLSALPKDDDRSFGDILDDLLIKTDDTDAKVTDTEKKTLDQSSTDLGAHDSSSVTQQTRVSETTKSEDLASQNVFFLLNVEEGDEDLKSSFLDELQDAVWEDFLSHDVKSLLTEEDQQQLRLKQDGIESLEDGDEKEQAQDEMVNFLNKLVPDLEQRLLDKALELKKDLFLERVNSLKDLYSDYPEKLSVISRAEGLIAQEKWRSAAEALNSID